MKAPGNTPTQTEVPLTDWTSDHMQRQFLAEAPLRARGRQRGCRPGHRRVKSAARAGPDDDSGPGEPPALRRHPQYGLVNEPLRRALDGDCIVCGRVLLPVNGETVCVWRPCERWGVPS